MMKTTADIEHDIWTVAKGYLTGKIGGSVYKEGTRPNDSCKEDAVVVVSFASTGQTQDSSAYVNIFVPNTPLHDGAVVIRDGVIVAAGCVLPLSNNLDLGKDMGTRHRACLGIAENSDAIAIVVSEETGIISMAKNGVLIRHFDRQSLYTRLIDEMIPKETASEKTDNSWKGRVKRLLSWVNQTEEDEQS